MSAIQAANSPGTTEQATPAASAASRRAIGSRSGWLHLCNGLDPVRDGGMVPSILGMTGALSRQGGEVTIVTPTPSRIDRGLLEPGLSLKGPETDLEMAVRLAEVVHMHGLWQGHTRRGAPTAIEAKVPYLIAAHGMVEPWALRQRRWKKSLYLALVEAKNLRNASCLHALSRPEIGHMRQIAPWTPIAFVPNGVDLDFFRDMPARSALEAEFPELKEKFVLLFMGRVHAKKGLDLLAEALRELCPERPDLHLLVAGKDDGAWGPFSSRIEQLGLSRRVTYMGHVGGEQARMAWAAADAFILPSYSEGFSMAILEALACSLPCLITTTCHFPEIADAGGAVMVEPEARAVTQGLRDLLDRTNEERRRMGEVGRRMVETQYTWEQQAHQLASVYQWLSGGGPPPDCVTL